MAEINVQAPQEGYQLVHRVASYPIVSTLIETGKNYYNWGKESSTIVNYAGTSLEGGIQLIVPQMEPLLESAKPILTKADTFGCSALDSFENNAQILKTNYEATKEAFELRVNTTKEATINALGQVQDKYISPADEYLKTALVAVPINIALEVTEKMLDHIFPTGEAKKNEIAQGPIAKTTILTKRIQQEAFTRIHNLTIQSPEKYNTMEYTILLLKYAKQSLDNGVNAVVTKSVEAAKEAPEKIQLATHDAMAAVYTAVGVVSAQIPADITNRFHQLKESVAANVPADVSFSSVAESSSKMLHEVTSTISGYVSRGENIPQQVLASTYSTLNRVLDSLLALVETKHEVVWSNEKSA